MRKGATISFSILMNFILVVIITVSGYAQDMGAVYWFKKGVNEKSYDKKIEFYQKAVQENPNFVEAYYNLALAFMNKKNYKGAEEAFQTALSANPNGMTSSVKSNILNRLGSLYRKAGRYAEAEEAFHGALNITKDKKFAALTLYELGQTKILQGKYDEAISYFRQGILSSPKERQSFETGIQLAKNQQKIDELYQQGEKLAKDQKFTEAVAKFNEIIAINPNHKNAKKRIDEITARLTQKQEQEDKQTRPLHTKATALMAEGNYSDAIKQFEQIKSIQPDYPEIDKLLSRAKEQQYQQLLNDQKIENYYVKGVENYESGNFSIALFNFEKVAELDQNYRDIETRIQATRREVNRVDKLANNASKSEEIVFSEPINNMPMESNFSSSSDLNTQQLITEKKQILNAAIDSQLVTNYYSEALNLMQTQDWQRAIILLEKVRLIEPGYKNTEFLLKQVRQNIEKADLASSNEVASDSKSGNPSALVLAFLAGIIGLPATLILISPTARARYYTLLRRYDKAREIYERMLSRKPNNVKLYITLANIYVNQNQIDEVSIRVIERAIQYNDDLKIQLEPILTNYYLQRSKVTENPTNLIQGALKEELRRMGN